jgi:uncharacterized membrane protein YccC
VSRLVGALRQSLRVDVHLVRPVAGLLTALPVVAVFAVGLGVADPRTAISMAIGANLIAIVSLVGAPRPPVRLAAVDAALMGLSVFVGTATGPLPWLHTIALVPWCFAAGLFVAFGQTQSIVGSQMVVAFVVLGRFSGSPLVALHLGALVFLGAIVEVISLLVLHLPPSLRYQRSALADAFGALADLARRDARRSATDASTVLDRTETFLAAPSLFGRTDVRELRAALDQARRMRLELTTLAGLRARLEASGDGAHLAIEQALTDLADGLDGLATQLRPGAATGSWAAGSQRYEQTVRRLRSRLSDADDGALGAQALEYLVAIGGQLRAAGALVTDARAATSERAWRWISPTVRGPGRERLDDARAIARASLQPSSPAFRHSLRMAVAVPLSYLIATWLGLPRPYWVPFAVAVILKPDYSTLMSRGVSRVVGTLFGATLAAVLVSQLHPDLAWTTVLVAAVAWAAYATWTASFALAIGLVTSLVLILLSTSVADTAGTAIDRFVDVVLGAAIAFAAYLVWPTSAQAGVSAAQAKLFGSFAEYLKLVGDLVSRRPSDAATITSRSRDTRLAWAETEAAVRRSIEEPSSTRVDPSEARGLMSAGMRIVRATHALRIEAERGATVPACDELDALIAGTTAALRRIAGSFEGRPLGATGELRALHTRLELALEALGAPGSISAHLDEIVNAVNTATHLCQIASTSPTS